MRGKGEGWGIASWILCSRISIHSSFMRACRGEPGYRRALARTFTYFIYYDVTADKIRLIAVLDQRSDPTIRWQQTTSRG